MFWLWPSENNNNNKLTGPWLKYQLQQQQCSNSNNGMRANVNKTHVNQVYAALHAHNNNKCCGPSGSSGKGCNKVEMLPHWAQQLKRLTELN